MKFLAALKFLTIIPLPGREVSPEEMGRATGFFPVVGIIIGLVLAGLNLLLSLVLPPAVISGLLIVFLVLTSGALHLDGFMDTCDSMAGHKTAQERWVVMQDSRVGAFGIAGAILLLLVKYVSLDNIPDSWLMATLVLMPVTGRWAMVYAILAYPYAKPSGLGVVFKQGTSWRQLTLATLTALVAAAVLLGLAGIFIMVGVWVVAMLMAVYLKRKFSGLTGDTYGAVNEVAEVGCLLLVLLLAPCSWLARWGGMIV